MTGRLVRVVAFALTVAAGGCRKGAPEPQAIGSARTYAVRGEVVRAVEPGQPAGQVLIRHEAIDEFVDAEGRLVGMASMVMPFELDAADARRLAVGDKVRLRFSVGWAPPSFRVVEVEALPRDTRLDFERRPTSATSQR